MDTQSILITGCSSGIGLDAAISLKKRGYRVFATARQAADVTALAEKGLESLRLDINDNDSIQAALDEITKRTGGTLYAVFNNAGYLQAGGAEDITRDMMRAQFETNTFGPMELSRRILPIMRRQGYGRIIQNTSILGIITMPYYSAYNASKFALEGYSSTLRQELRGTRIHVSIIAPGPITSKLRQHAFEIFKRDIANQQSGIHAKTYQNMEHTYFHPSKADQKIMQSPSSVTAKLIHALESKHPKAHYYVGLPAHIFAYLRRLLPDNALDWILCNIRKDKE